MTKEDLQGFLLVLFLLALAWAAWRWEDWFGGGCPRTYCKDLQCEEARQGYFWRDPHVLPESCSLCRQEGWTLHFPDGDCVDFGVIIKREYCDGDSILMEPASSGENVPPRIRHPQFLRKWREGKDFPKGSWAESNFCINCQTGESISCSVQVNIMGPPEETVTK